MTTPRASSSSSVVNDSSAPFRWSSIPYIHLLQTSWRYAEGRRKWMATVIALGICTTLVSLLQPLAVGKLVDALQTGGPHLLQHATFWLGAYVVLKLVAWLFHGPARVIEKNLALHVKQNFLQYHYRLLTQLPMRWHQAHHSGNTLDRITKSSTGLFSFGYEQSIFIQTITRLIGTLAALTWISWGVGAAATLFAAGILVFLAHHEKKQTDLLRERNELEHLYSTSFFDYVTNMASVIAFNLSRQTTAKLQTALQAVRAPFRLFVMRVEWEWFNWDMLGTLALFAILYGYIRFYSSPGHFLVLGTVVVIYQYLQRLNEVFAAFAGYYQRLTQQYVDVRASEPLAAEFKRLADRPEGRFELQTSKGEIRFERVEFAYHPGRPVFENLDLVIPARQKVGIVGHSGAGKTTLMQLLLRFQDPTGGRITIDGQDIGHATQESLRRNLALIPQDVSLFETSLLENIRYGRIDASDAEVIEAARRAHADVFIDPLPEGYQTRVGERGVRLSGGQRQRIAIARAILRNAPILILDEATSALDSASERYIQNSLAELMEGKTVIAIAHRLSTLSHLDRLVILNHGRIVEEGSHAELLAREGAYAKLWALQSGGFLPE